MIISHQCGFIFIKGGKVGGTSFEIRLTPHCGEDDVITPFGVVEEDARDEQARSELAGGRGAQNYLPKIWNWGLEDFRRVLQGKNPRPKYWNHMPAEDIRRNLNPSIWSSYTKVGILRDPFDTAVSLYFWSQESERGPISKVGFQTWLLANAHRLNHNWNMMLVDGQMCLDVVINYENPTPGLSILVAKTGLSASFLAEQQSYRAKSGHRPKWATVEYLFSEFPEGFEAVSFHCAEQIEFLKQEMPGH
jgi:hypothetical protein